MYNGVFSSACKFFLRRGDYATYRFHANYFPKRITAPVNGNMPKDYAQLLVMQRQRQKLKKKNERYVASTVSLQVLGSGARGAPTSLYVSTDHTKYLFNCGEGTQRLSYEHHLRLAKLEHVFVTTPSWRNLGGLPGLALTVQDSGVPELKIHGPAGSSDLFKAVERFVILQNLTVSELICKDDVEFVDRTMTVRYVPLFKEREETENSPDSENESEPIPVDEVDYYAHEVNSNGKRSSSQERKRRKFSRSKPEDQNLPRGRIFGTMAYICKLHPKAGTLQLEKCVDRGVTPGPLLGDLKAGKDVTLPDGTVVLSSEVTSPMDPGPVFIVLECPDEDYLEALVNCEAFEKHQAATSSDETEVANCVVHFTPESVMKDPRYRRWMEKFGRTTRHMIINEENTCIGSEAIHRIQHQLHLLHPTIFPFLNEEGMTVVTNRANSTVFSLSGETDKADKPETSEEEFPLINRAKTLDAMHLRPPTGFDKSAELVLAPREYIDETFAVDGFLDALAELQTRINARTTKDGDKLAEYPKIVMLGTGSCIPNKTRNTSGILLRVDEETSIILDCGEGTAGQLVRFYGKNEVDKILSTIKAIYVSHLHADHHIGLVGLLHERARVTKVPVTLLAPEQIGPWLRFYHKRFEPISEKYVLVSNKDLYLAHRQAANEAINVDLRLEQALGGIKFATVRVKHCPHAFGLLVTLENGCKIVYSGDTMPCDALAELGEDCDLLIHEATMEDELEDEARLKHHSTISQAITVGERMRAKFILLTHFSQRYSKIPHLPDSDASPNLSRVGIAYDNMQVSLSQLDLLPLLYPSLKLMFNEFCTDLKTKALKRQVRLEREAREMKNKMI